MIVTKLAAVLAVAFLMLTPTVGLANEHEQTTTTTTLPDTTTTTTEPETTTTSLKTTTTTIELPTTTTTVPTENPLTSALLSLCRVIHDQNGDRTHVLVDELDQAALEELQEQGYVLFEGTLPVECIPVPPSDPTSDGEPAPEETRAVQQPFVDLDCKDFTDHDFPVQPGDPHGLDADDDGVACETDGDRDGQRTAGELPHTGQPGWLPLTGAGLMGAGGLLFWARRKWIA